MNIWTLLENTACRDGFGCEHGLSLYIEAGSRKILFDMGQSGIFAENGEKLGLDLSQVDTAIVSHGHYDHGGGLARFLEINAKAKVYVSKFAFEGHYHGADRYIGLEPGLADSDRIVLADGFLDLGDGLELHPAALLKYPLDTGGLHVLEKGALRDEDFRHEQYLRIQEGEKTVLFSGCSHRGIRNIAAHFQPDVLVGGFHFMKVTDRQRLKEEGEALLTLPTRYYTGHCTGIAQFEFLKGLMGERLEGISAGCFLEI